MDILGDFLTIIRNGVMRGKPFVVAPFSKMKLAVAQLLLQEGFVTNVEVVQHPTCAFREIKVSLKYVKGESAIHEIVRESRPGRRLYQGVHDFKPVAGGLGISIVSTHKGIMTNKQAREAAVGGELLCSVW